MTEEELNEENLDDATAENDAAEAGMENDLQARYDALQAKANSYLDDLQRERASFTNFRKRMEQENADKVDRGLGEQIKAFLPVIDDLERALKHRPESQDQGWNSWADGTALILQKLLTTLANKGVSVLQVEPGDAFDPTTQEAVTHEECDEFCDNQVIEVLQPGYKYKEHLIRPALVRVAK